MSAEERYIAFFENNKELFNQVPLQYIASMLGMTSNIRLVSRNPEKVNDTNQLFPADITKHYELENAVKNSKIVYVTVGFEYSYKVWEENWPTFIKELIVF